MPSFKVVFFIVIVNLAFLNPDLIIDVCNALPLRAISLLHVVADWLGSAEESLLARIGTSVLLTLTDLLHRVVQILQKADRITTAAGHLEAGLDLSPASYIKHGDDALPFLHTVFQRMLESIRILIVSLEVPSLIQEFAFQLHCFVIHAHRFLERALLFQWIVRRAMTMVIGHVAAARLIAFVNIALYLLQYRFGRIALTLLAWLLGLFI